MHSALDPCDLVPDEAQQLAHSGYEVGDLQDRALRAAADGDLAELAEIERELTHAGRSLSWEYQEPRLADDVPVEDLQPLPVDWSALESRLRGAWLGRAVGNTLGKPIEGMTRREVETYLRAGNGWPQRGYVRLVSPPPAGVSWVHPSAPESTLGNFDEAPRDDDIDWTLLGLHLVETYGDKLTTADIEREWLDRIPFTQTYTAERAAYRNLIHGLHAPETALVRNPYREWIGALIRADIFGYVNPGDPSSAVRAALVDARLTHTANGVYGEMWAAALVSTALATDDIMTAFERALHFVPARSRLADALRKVRAHREAGTSWTAALDWVDEELGHYNWVHTVNNAALISIGLLWGDDFTDSVAICLAGGRDTDSNGATVGSVYGALHGDRAIPSELVGTTHTVFRSSIRDFDRVSVDELVARTLAVVRRRDRDEVSA